MQSNFLKKFKKALKMGLIPTKKVTCYLLYYKNLFLARQNYGAPFMAFVGVSEVPVRTFTVNFIKKNARSERNERQYRASNDKIYVP
tara:strand:- start:425 stop:685 length:261 start_codon:yes stop_codon:yes gene_type:complete